MEIYTNMTIMKKIAVIGSGGSGKSTFSRRLGELLHLPVYHLDKLHWKPGWIPTPREEWDQIIKELVEKDTWIIDGNYGRTIDMRINTADTIIFLDMPRYICMYRIFKRRWMYHGKTRPDLTEGCPEKLDFEFVSWIWNYRKKKRPDILLKLYNLREEKNIIQLQTPKDVKKFLDQLNKSIISQTTLHPPFA